MKYLEQINEVFFAMLDTNIYKLVTDIAFYNREQEFGLQGDFFDSHERFLAYASYKGKAFLINESILKWQSDALQLNTPWNKAIFTTYSDGHFEVKTWWDEDFQKQLYPNG
ncbi:hypothetical protein [Runella zeae]|uniref:hypothetical protein n=1 Tax=Runella zeae TaxID=94255 RepID=UPI0003FE55D9|nr:hypothetical protein [Runella zeae]